MAKYSYNADNGQTDLMGADATSGYTVATASGRLSVSPVTRGTTIFPSSYSIMKRSRWVKLARVAGAGHWAIQSMQPCITALIVVAVVLCGCAHNRHRVSEALPDTSGKLMTQFGEFSPIGSPWTVRVSDSDRRLNIARHTAFGSTGVSPSDWKAQPGWFAFVENDQRAWAYDGDRNLFLLRFTGDGTVSYGPSVFPCPVPDVVFSRLSEATRRAIKRHEK